MPNPDSTYTREEHQAAILGLYVKNIKSGMGEAEAMEAAGAEWRKQLRELADAKIAFVKAALGIPESDSQ